MSSTTRCGDSIASTLAISSRLIAASREVLVLCQQLCLERVHSGREGGSTLPDLLRADQAERGIGGEPFRIVDVLVAGQAAVDRLPASDRVILLSACRQLTALEAEIEGIEGEIARCVVDVPAVQVLLTITSVGLITAAATWAIVGNPHRFPRAKQVTRYAGLDPSIVQSGEQHRQGHISKAGSPLRTLLVEAANSLARWDSGPLGQFYTRKAQEVGPRKAIIALACKLLIVAWRMLLTGEVYRAARATVVARKQREVLKKTRIQLPSTRSEG